MLSEVVINIVSSGVFGGLLGHLWLRSRSGEPPSSLAERHKVGLLRLRLGQVERLHLRRILQVPINAPPLLKLWSLHTKRVSQIIHSFVPPGRVLSRSSTSVLCLRMLNLYALHLRHHTLHSGRMSTHRELVFATSLLYVLGLDVR